MRVIYEKQFRTALQSVVEYIAKDKVSVSIAFKRKLKEKFEMVTDNPRMHRASLYIRDDDSYRDLIYMGYTVIYKIGTDVIRVLDIFKWEDKKYL